MEKVDNRAVLAENLNYYLRLRGLRQIEAAQCLGVSPSTFSSWCKGQKMPRMDKIEQLADFFQVRKSDLIEVRPAPKQHKCFLNERDRRDIGRQIRRLRTALEEENDLMFDGCPMTPAAKESVLAAMETALVMVKRLNKKKFTPGCYKKDGS